MEIKPIDSKAIGKAIINLDKLVPENNPSIFMQEVPQKQNTFDDKTLNNLLYDC